MKLLDVSTPRYPSLFALVDDDVFELVSQFKWTGFPHRKTFYAMRRASSPTRRTCQLHRFILGAPEGMQVDHIDGNGLNNQKTNLRICTASQNQCNRRIQRNNTSGYVGVTWWPRDCNWKAEIKSMGKKTTIGYFPTPELAARARDIEAIRRHGKFARLNYPRETYGGAV